MAEEKNIGHDSKHRQSASSREAPDLKSIPTSKELDDDQKRKDRHRYLTCVCLIQDVAKDVLLDVLKSRISGEQYGKALYGMKNRLLPFLNNHQSKLLYPDGLHYNGDLSDMDISLLYIILRNLNVICPHQKGWGNYPEEQDRSISANIDRIRVAKNRIIAHASNCSLGYAEFNNIWGTIRQCCLELGGEKYEERIDMLLTLTENKDYEQKFLESLEKFKTEEMHQEMQTRKIEEILSMVKEISESLANSTKDGEKDIQLPWLVDAKKFHNMLSHGEYLSYEHRLSLGGPCSAGKSTLASVLIGDEIPLQWNSTDGLVILFGRNGIDIDKNKMVPLKKGEGGHDVLAKMLRGEPEQSSEQFTRKVTTTKRTRSQTGMIPSESPTKFKRVNEECKTTIYSRKQCATGTYDSMTKSDFEPFTAQHSNRQMPATANMIQTLDSIKQQLQSDILEEVRNKQYKIKIAPSDLIDFGGQKSYDMTHQLFIQHQGSFVLMFDGRIGLHEQLKEYPEEVTAASILKHWVDSILTYTDDSEDIMPMILFAATHRDKCKEDTTEMKKRFSSDIKQMFEKYENKHIHLDTVYFINATDTHDVEIQHMTDQIVMFAMKQSSWGQRRPMQWVPLELQISNMKMEKINIITKEDIRNVNDLNKDLALEEGQLNDFLLVQHSLGKLMYYNLHGLDKFIIIHPPALVNILRSFVTDETFFPAENDLKSILQSLTETGKIVKTDLLKLWQQDHLKEYMPNDSIKEFILQLLIHLDILIIPKANTQNSVHNVYLVPCMIKVSRPLGFNSNESQIQRTICLRYSLALHSIPTALAYKIIGASITSWPLQDENGKLCLYHKAAELNVNEDNEIRIWLEENRVLISLANQKSLLDISPDIAASVQECLTKNLVSSLSFYYNSFGRKINQRKVSDLYTMEVGIPCGKSVCFISSQEVTNNDKWICDNGKEHETRYLRNWIFNKSQKTCGRECKGLNDNEMRTEPSDKHLVRLGCQIGIKSFEDFFINLGMERIEWENTEYMYAGHSPEDIMSMAMKKWKTAKLSKQEDPTLEDLSCALTAVNLNSHLICQVFREETRMFDIADFNLQTVPSDHHLKELSNRIGNCPLQLGVELGLSFTDVEQSLFKFQRDLPGLVEDILGKWREKSKVKTIHSLMMALERVRAGGFRYLRDISNLL